MWPAILGTERATAVCLDPECGSVFAALSFATGGGLFILFPEVQALQALQPAWDALASETFVGIF